MKSSVSQSRKLQALVEKERVKLAKRDRKEANGLLDAVEAQDVPRVAHLLAIGVNPNARIDNAHPCSVKGLLRCIDKLACQPSVHNSHLN